MRLRNTVILIVVAAVLAGYYLLVEQPRHRRAQMQQALEFDLAAFFMEDAVAVTIVRPDVTLEFERAQSGAWMMIRPVRDRAQDGSVNRLLGAVSDAVIDRNLGPQEDLSPFGLAEPEASITVLARDGNAVVTLDVGGLTVEKYNAYARRPAADNPADVLLVPTGIRRYATAEPSSFRYERVVDFDLASVRHFTVDRPGRRMTWRRAQDGGWSTVVDGKEIRGDKRMVEEVLRRVRGLRVAEFVPVEELPVVRPFDAPARSIDVSLIGDRGQALKVGRRLDSRLYAGSRLSTDAPERVVLTDTTVLDIFDQNVFDLRDRRMLDFDRGRAGKLVLESAAVNATLVRPGDEWAFPNPAMGAIDQQKVARALSALAELEYEKVLDENPADAASYGLSNADLRLTIFDEAGGEIDVMVCTREGDNVVATSGYSGVIAVLREGEMDAIVNRFKDLRQP